MKPRSPVQKNNLVVFLVNIPMCTPIDTRGIFARRLGQLSNFSVKLRLSSSVQTRVLGTQKNRIIETVVLSTHQFFCKYILVEKEKK